MIRTTLTGGQQKKADPGAKELFDQACKLPYTAAYGYDAFSGDDQAANPVGIVTAYSPDTTLTTGQAQDQQTEGYRTDCPIFEPMIASN